MANHPIYECFSLFDFMHMPRELGKFKISRYAVKEVKNNIVYVIVNIYDEEEENETNNQES